MNAVFLMPAAVAKRARAIAEAAGLEIEARPADSQQALHAAVSSPVDVLLSFGTSVIVPEDILKRPGLIAINIHGASPRYPGRDPHHFAAFDAVTEYGATMHVMTKHVDAGPIIDVELFAVEHGCAPVELLRRANEAGFVLLRRLFESLKRDLRVPPPTGAQWGPHRYTRAEFLELCRLDVSMTRDEIDRRLHAVAMPGYNNAYVVLHGRRFRLDGSGLEP